jgi:LacI family transcriptional regulator
VPDLTLEDVAKLAGVSRSTVSRVVNNHPNVRDDVRQRVLKIIQNTGYHPNVAARSLASQRSWMIGLVLPRSVSSFFADPYFPRLTQGIAQACNQHNYTLALFLVGSAEDEDKIFPRVSRKGLLDGILVQSGQIGDQLIDRLVNSSIPLVIGGRPFHADEVSYIDVDNVKAANMAVSHLIQLGYKRVGTISGLANLMLAQTERKVFESLPSENWCWIKLSSARVISRKRADMAPCRNCWLPNLMRSLPQPI